MADNTQQDEGQAAPRRPALAGSCLVRAALGGMVVIGIVVIAGVITFLLLRASRDKPLEVEMMAGARQVANEILSDHADHQQYVSIAPVAEIIAFFDRQEDTDCHDQYAQVSTQSGGDPVREGYLYTSCLRDRSWLDMTQYNEITIQPQTDASGQPTGEVLIDVRRYWGN